MRRSALAWSLVLLLTSLSFSATAAHVLIVDQTLNLMESMQVEILARALLGSGLFSINAVTDIPNSCHPAAPFDCVVVIPPSCEWVWVCVPGLPEGLPMESQQPLTVLKDTIEEVFLEARSAAEPAQDLFPFLLSAYFLNLGVLERIE